MGSLRGLLVVESPEFFFYGTRSGGAADAALRFVSYTLILTGPDRAEVVWVPLLPARRYLDFVSTSSFFLERDRQNIYIQTPHTEGPLKENKITLTPI